MAKRKQEEVNSFAPKAKKNGRAKKKRNKHFDEKPYRRQGR